MLELASHIVETKAGHFEPEKFEAPVPLANGGLRYANPPYVLLRATDLPIRSFDSSRCYNQIE
jgi:hypothetical protein